MIPLARELLACKGEYGVREPEVGGAVRIQSIQINVKGRR